MIRTKICVAWVLILGLSFICMPNARAETEPPARSLWDLAKKFYGLLVAEYRWLTPRPPSPETEEAKGPHQRFEDGTELEFDLTLDNLMLAKPLLIEKRGTGFLFRLSHFIEVLEFPITVDETAGTARGWFLREGNPFELNLKTRTLRTGSRTEDIAPGVVERRDNEIWISDKVAADWFGIDFEIDFRQLRIALNPSEPLPAQQRIARRSQRLARRARHSLPPKHPLYDAPKPTITVPSFDTQLTGQIGRTDTTPLTGQLDYATQIRNGLFGATFEGFLAGDTDKPFEAARASLTFEEPDGVWGIKPITQFSIGDVRGVRTPLLGSGSLERGIYLSNLPLGRQINTDTTIIEGNSFPGYDVQLFRNNVLIGFQEIGEDGRYEFRDVPVFAGDNTFRLLFFGPQGQQDEEVRTITLDPTSLGANGLGLEVSLTQQETGLFDEALSQSPASSSFRAAIRAQYPLTSALALEAGLETLNADGARQVVGSTGLSLTGKGWRLRGALASNQDGEIGGESVFQARLGKVASLRLEHREEGNLTVRGAGNFARLSRAGLTGRAKLGGGKLPPLTYDLSAVRQTAADGVNTLDVGLGLGTQISGVSVSNTVSHLSSSADGFEDNLRGAGQVMAIRGPMRLRLGSSYILTPKTELTGWEAEVGYRHSRTFDSEVEVRNDTNTGVTTYGASVNYDAGFARFAPRLSYDTRNRLSGLLTMRMAAARDPSSGDWQIRSQNNGNAGRLSVRVFYDLDGDGQFGDGDTVLEGVKVDLIQQRTGAITNGDGVAFIAGLRPFETSDVEIVADTLPETWLQPAAAGWSYMPRPGIGHSLNLPVVRIWTISGRVFDVSDAAPQAMAGVSVILRNRETGDVARRVKTAADGRYELAAIRRGAYRLDLDTAELVAGRFQAAPARFISTSERTEQYRELDLVTAKAGVPIRYPSLAGRNQGPLAPLGAGRVATDGVVARHAILIGHSRTRLGVTLRAVRLKRRAPDLLGRLRPLVGRAETESIAGNPQADFPIRLGHFESRDPAERVCDILRANGELCSVVLDWVPMETAERSRAVRPKT